MKDLLTEEEKSILCLRCHECCKMLPLSLKYDPKSEMFKQVSEFFLAHGCDAMVMGNIYIISIPHRCQHLTEMGCAIYKDRPKVCREYDGRKDPRLVGKCLWVKAQKGSAGFTQAASFADRAEVKIT